MRDLLWLLGFATFPLFGLLVWRLDVVKRMDLPGRIAAAFAAGIVFVTTLMWAFAVVGITWTRVTLGLPLAALLLSGVRRPRRRSDSATEERRHGRRTPDAGILLFLTLTAYGIFTARETCADLLYFWGPKAQRFWMTGTIDVGFLGFPHYYLMHPDYPPLLPEAFAFASNFAHRFSWWGALGTMLLFLAASAAVLRAFVGGRKGGWYALLLTAVLGYGYSTGMVAGAADPLLIFFELVALCAVTFADDGGTLAAIALAGAVMTKVEGAVFAVVLVVALLLIRRKVLRAIATVAPAAILLATWIAFCWKHGLLDQYARAKQRADWSLTGLVVRKTFEMASYQAFYLPWLAPLATLPVGRQWKRAALPLLVTAGSLAYIVFFYLHIDAQAGDPAWWVASSAERVLLTPLMSLVVAAAAASE